MSPQALAYAAAAAALVGLIAYAVLAGADFGGGLWDLLAAGPRRREQQDAIAHARWGRSGRRTTSGWCS